MTTKKAEGCFGGRIRTLPMKPYGKMDRIAKRKDMALRMDRSYICPMSEDHLIMGSAENICCVTCNNYWRRSDVKN